MSSKPSISITQAPLTPKHSNAREAAQSGLQGTSLKSSLTPGYSWGLGFLPSFPLQSPRNISIYGSASPLRFLTSAMSLNKALKKDKDDKNVFNTSTPSRDPSNKFLDSLSSVNGKKSGTPDDTTHDGEDASLWSVNESHITNLTIPLEHTPKQPTEKKSPQKEFLTPNKMFIQRQDTLVTKKRRLSIEASPNSSIASKIETIASPPRSASFIARHSSITSTSKSSDEKVWHPELDEILMSSYTKFKIFKDSSTSNNATILKNVSQNKVLSRMLLNKCGILRTPKQIASRLFKLNKYSKDKRTSPATSGDHSQNILDESPSLNDQIDEIIRTPLEDLIGSAASHLDSISSAEINAQIDKELDLIFSPSELQSSPFPAFSTRTDLSDFQIYYSGPSCTHYFIKSHSMSSRLMESSTKSFMNKLKISPGKSALLDRLTNKLIEAYELKKLMVLNASNHLDLKMAPGNTFNSLDSVISNSNPLNLEEGSINSFMKLSIRASPEDADCLAWNCFTRIFKGDNLLLTSNDPIIGYRSNLDTFEMSIPFLKNFWSGYISLLINGNDDKSVLDELSIVQVIYDREEKVEACLIHRFDKSNSYGRSSMQMMSYSTCRDDLNDLKEEDEDLDEPTQQDKTQSFSEDNSIDDDNETILANSSPLKMLEPPARPSINLAAARSISYSGPASAPIYNPRIVQQINQSANKVSSPVGNFPQHSASTSDITSFLDSARQLEGPALKSFKVNGGSPNGLSPFVGLESASKLGFGTPQDAMSSTPLKSFGSGQRNLIAKPSNSENGMVSNSQLQNLQNPSQNQGSLSNSSNAISQSLLQNNGSFTTQNTQQLMVNVGGGYIPFNSLPPEFQERYMGVQRQFEYQRMLQIQQQQLAQILQLSQGQQAQSQLGSAFPNMNTLQNLSVNNMNTMAPMSAPASQTSFLGDMDLKKFRDTSKKPGKENRIQFGPMLEYDPSKDHASIAAAKAKSKKSKRPGVGVLDVPRDSPVYMYKPREKKSFS